LNWFENYASMLHGSKRISILKRTQNMREEIHALLDEHNQELCSQDTPLGTVLRSLETLKTMVTNLETQSIIRNSGDPGPQGQSPYRTQSAAISSDFCPTFCGMYSSYDGWATVGEMIKFEGDVKAWIIKKGVWSLNGGDELRGGAGRVFRARCKYGGNALKEKKVHGQHGWRQDPAFPNFEPCPCELKVCYTPGFIVRIEIRIAPDGRSHTHGDIEDAHVGKGVIRKAIKMDPSLAVHNILMDNLSASSRPGTILSSTQQQIIERPNGEVDRAEIIRRLNFCEFKRDLGRACSKIRSLRGRRVSSIENLVDLCKERKQEYREYIRRDPLRAVHFPRIIGFNHSVDANGDLDLICLTISTDRMLKFAAAHGSDMCFSTDVTFKKITSGYHLLTTGFMTNRRHFQLVSVSLIIKENTRAYRTAFRHLTDAIEKLCSKVFSPEFLIADCHASITSSVRAQFPSCQRKVCLAHVLRACRLHFKSKCGIDKFDPIARNICLLARARCRAQFRYWLVAFRQSIPAGPALDYVDRKDGFFDVDSWMSRWYDAADSLDEIWTPCTNNGCEGTNLRIKELVFQNRILTLSDSLSALLGGELMRFSTEADKHEEESLQRYQDENRLWSQARKSDDEIKYLKQEDGYDVYFVNMSENDTYETVMQHNPFYGSIGKKAIVFLPDHEGFNLNAPPTNAGPYCTCDHYAIKNVCYHIPLIMLRTNRPYVITEPDCPPQTNISKPKPSFGLRRPKNPTSALNKM
jgi:hypothetical protein